MTSSSVPAGRLGQVGMKWNLFLGAAILVGGLLLKLGAPLPSVIAGIGLAAILTWQRGRTAPPGSKTGL
jgi:hypothetical protein